MLASAERNYEIYGKKLLVITRLGSIIGKDDVQKQYAEMIGTNNEWKSLTYRINWNISLLRMISPFGI
jgi:hypothetical protein